MHPDVTPIGITENTWLITGVQGFIGRYLVDRIARESPTAVILGVGRSPALAGLFSYPIAAPAGPVLAPLPDELRERQGRLVYRALDITDAAQLAALLLEFRPAHIVHLAAARRGDSRDRLLQVNVAGTAALFEAIGRIDGYLPGVLLGSSGAVYGQTRASRLPLRESEACEPADDYGRSKLAAESVATTCSQRLGLRLVVARIFNSLGAGQDEKHVAGRIALELSQAQRAGACELQLGSLAPTRDFIDVRDVARALFRLAADDRAAGVFNIGSGVERTVAELLDLFFACAGVCLPVQQKSEWNPGVLRHYAHVGRLLQTGFHPLCPLEESVAAVWNYCRRLG